MNQHARVKKTLNHKNSQHFIINRSCLKAAGVVFYDTFVNITAIYIRPALTPTYTASFTTAIIYLHFNTLSKE